jgi:hypothetical protein
VPVNPGTASSVRRIIDETRVPDEIQLAGASGVLAFFTPKSHWPLEGNDVDARISVRTVGGLCDDARDE